MQTVILPALAQPNLLWFNSNKQLNFYFSKDMLLQQLNYSTFSFFSQCNYNIAPIEPYRVNVTIHMANRINELVKPIEPYRVYVTIHT